MVYLKDPKTKNPTKQKLSGVFVVMDEAGHPPHKALINSKISLDFADYFTFIPQGDTG